MSKPRTFQQPLISVITVVRNGRRFLTHALDSIFEQSYRPVQVIVVDGQSTDGSDQIARSYEDVECVSQTSLGLGAARNQGIEQARGAYIAFLDHDDTWLAAKLETQIRYMMAHPDLYYSTTQFVWFRDASAQPLRATSAVHHLMSPQTAPTPGTFMARREAFRLNGLFDATLHVACDSEWFVRARNHGLAAHQIPAVLMHKRLHDTNLSAQTELYRREWLRVLRDSTSARNRTNHPGGQNSP